MEYPAALASIPCRFDQILHADELRRQISSDHTNFRLWTRNTLIIAILSVTGTMVSSSLVAYGFARIRFRGRGFWFGLMLSTMMIPFPVIMAPLFVIFVWLGRSYPNPAWMGTLSRCGCRNGSDRLSAFFCCGNSS